MHNYNSLEDFLNTNTLSVDGQWKDDEAYFPVKGKEIDATVLFADIRDFSKRTQHLSPTETLILVNIFFTPIATESLRGRGIIDKYIGDEIMIVFSKEFGSKDPFIDAIQTARWMSEHDVLAFNPHVGIASGKVTVGYVGTPSKYSCSVFGAPVTLAARCAKVDNSDIVFPAIEWEGRCFDDIFKPTKYKGIDGKIIERPVKWKLSNSRKIKMKNLDEVAIRELCRLSRWFPYQYSAEEEAKEILQSIQNSGRYWGASIMNFAPENK